jgi:Cytochrome C'
MRTTTTTLVIAAAVTFASVTYARQTARTPTTVKEVMTAMTIPASDAVFDAGAEPPTSAEAWAALRKSAVTLAESGRLLMTDALGKDKTTWNEMARDLVREAEATIKVAEAKDRDALENAGDSVYATCKACHGRYMEAVN